MKKVIRNLAGLAVAGGAAWLGAAVLFRPLYRRWGATREELDEALPGDEVEPKWKSTHAITIHAPVDEVWRWLVQIGQDKGGFYSYTFLENLALAGIHNADEVHPEWQELRAGDTVRLACGKVYGDRPLLKVKAVVPNYYLLLEGWGAFVVKAVNANTTRLIIRTHEGEPMLGPLFDLLFFEPAHFVMERGMMRGIRKRAEKSHRERVQSIAA